MTAASNSRDSSVFNDACKSFARYWLFYSVNRLSSLTASPTILEYSSFVEAFDAVRDRSVKEAMKMIVGDESAFWFAPDIFSHLKQIRSKAMDKRNIIGVAD